ncbi:Permuted papain-like amidase enzyme, YaeF/YiiX, C92 family [Variovorax sp. OK212]|nr:Permuted papain-like amidase enzyme, YaeF/YiiX, C92 family [Variovorax sp. OK202]SFC04181.1 Permuted papain-like amidase enzyme, YaeF/YiiX, C92 family [Variovorax sp. OK212]
MPRIMKDHSAASLALLAALLAVGSAISAAQAAPAVHAARATDSLKDGDIVFHTSRSAQSVAVQRATGSRYSHMGIVLLRNGKPYVFEAVQTVRYTPLAQWAARGSGGHYVAKRLRNADTLLTPGAVARLRAGTSDFEGRPYDLTFEWSDKRIYCSELVWKLYQRALGVRIGELQKIREFNLNDPAVRAKMRERYGDKVPMDEPVISPVAMFDSPLLRTVETR